MKFRKTAKASSKLGVLSKDRKSVRTRRRLLEAAMSVLGERGVDNLSVAAINQEAGLSQGTFYLYFKDRWDIVIQLFKQVSESIRDEMDVNHIGAADPAQRVAYATQRVIEYYVSNPKMGWVIVRLTESNTDQIREIRRLAGQGMIDDLMYGIRQGRFLIQMDDFLLDGIRAIYGGAIRDRLKGNDDKQISERATELTLRLLGISASEAHWLSRKYRSE